MRKVVAAACIAIMAFGGLPLLASHGARAATLNKANWQGVFLAQDARLNQTISTNKVDTYSEVGLSADVLKYMYYSGGDYPAQINIPITLTANTRHSTDWWSVYPNSDNFQYWGWSAYSTVSLGDDQGYYLELGTLRQEAKLFFYGQWYDSIMICSNGYVILDKAVKNYKDANNIVTSSRWISTSPTSFGNTADPNCIIAPLWRDLNPSANANAKIKYGFVGNYFVVLWENVPNYSNGALQTFAVSFYTGSWGFNVGEQVFRFHYKSISKDVTTQVGVESQNGKQGYTVNYAQNVNSGRMLEFYFGSNAAYTVQSVKLIVNKYDAGGTANDPNANIHLTGPSSQVPGGMNLVYVDPSKTYNIPDVVDQILACTDTSLQLVSIATEVMLALGYATPFGGLIFGGSLLLSGIGLITAFSPAYKADYKETADSTTQSVYVKCLGNDEDRPYKSMNSGQYPWNTALNALVEWKIKAPTVTHFLKIKAEVVMGRYDSSSWYTLTTDELVLKLDPQQSPNPAWLPRTISSSSPNAHFMNFNQISTEFGQGYHIDTTGSADYGYDFMGWTKLTPNTPDDYVVGTYNGQGYARISGYFSQYDTLSGTDAPGRRMVNAYFMYSETGPLGSPPNFGSMNNIVYRTTVLDSTAAVSSWQWKTITIQTSSLIPGKAIKLGIGRPDSWSNDWQLTAEWSQVELKNNPNLMRIDLRNPWGGGSATLTSPGLTPITSSGSYEAGRNTVWTATATPSAGYAFNYWVINGQAVSTNPCQVTLSGDTSVEITFRLARTGGCVLEGTNLTLADGTTVKVENLKKGMELVGYNTTSHELVKETVISSDKTKVDQILLLNGGLLCITPDNQPIYARHDGWEGWVKNPIELHIGWEVFMPLEGKWISVEKMELRQGKFTVYDPHLSSPDNYIANGLLLDKKIP